MAIAHRAVRSHSCTFEVWDGNIDEEEVRAHLLRLAEDPDWPPGTLNLVDLSTVGDISIPDPELVALLREGTLLETELKTDVRGRIARKVVESGYDLLELRSMSMSLEDVFLQLTGAPPSENGAGAEVATGDGQPNPASLNVAAPRTRVAVRPAARRPWRRPARSPRPGRRTSLRRRSSSVIRISVEPAARVSA